MPHHHYRHTVPIRLPPQQMPVVHKEEVHRLIQVMLACEIIQPSTSPWASLFVIVRKKDGSLRFVWTTGNSMQ